MTIPIRIQLALIVSVAMPVNGSACSCYVRPLAQRYESASVVLVARVGELRDSYDPSGTSVRGWSFEAVEVLKGDIGFGELMAGSCGGYLFEGREYLIFTGNDGEVDSCRTGDLSLDARYRADLEVLREMRKGSLETVAEPWAFDKRDGMCSLSLDMFNGGALSFDYRFADAVELSSNGQQFRYDLGEHRTVRVKDVGLHPANFAGFSRLRIWYPYSEYKLSGTGRLTIGGREWTTQLTTMEGSYSSPFEVVADSAFSEALSAVEANKGAWLSAEYGEFPFNHDDHPDFPEIKTGMPHYYLGTAVQRFQECIDRAGQ